MNFYVNDIEFNNEINEGNELFIKSYDKDYNVSYSKKNLNTLLNEVYNEKDFIIIDKNVYNLSPHTFAAIPTNYYYLFNAIEETKNIESVLDIADILYNLKFNKKNKLIVIGGGITQDVSGFVAGIYKRGLNWVFIPTTVLSMTDSCIGGKVGVNRNSKNMLGLFVAPNKIFISDFFIPSLTHGDVISGLGESLKLALIGGTKNYQLFKKHFQTKNYMEIIKISNSIKKSIIEYDELERNERRVLNYGHTLGHALESASNYIIPHGIAVLYGMYMINEIFYYEKYEEVNNFILDIIPHKFKNLQLSYNTFVGHILNDKKNDGENICFILLNEIGDSIFVFKKLNKINDQMKLIFEELFITSY